jgi:hypothetical protein
MLSLIIYNRGLVCTKNVYACRKELHSGEKLAGCGASDITVRNEKLWYAVRHMQQDCMLCVCAVCKFVDNCLVKALSRTACLYVNGV